MVNVRDEAKTRFEECRLVNAMITESIDQLL